MHKRFAAALLLSACPLIAGFDDPAPAPQPIDVGFVVRNTDFFAHNFSTDPQVLFFRSGSFVTWRVLQPGATFTSTYARQALDGLRLEVARLENGLWLTSGNYELGAVCDSGADAIWVQRGLQPASWRELGSILTQITTEATALPEWLPMPTVNESTPPLQPLHIPVVNPVDRPQGDIPPVLDDKPLPPV
ncbi:MAG: hypothetical protein JNL28_16525 [Planctomycetes bacterium]|nr:hypothetical protein [Planctomycetota bacterium]